MRRLLAVASLVLAMGTVSFTAVSPAGAAGPILGPGGSTTFGTLAAGVACPFAVSIDLVSGGAGHSLTFLDANGNPSRIMLFAQPSTWKITNLETGESATVRIPAAQWRIVPAPDGSATIYFAGGVIGFNAPTDTPPGPFALTNAGRIVFVVAPDGTGTLQTLRGRTTYLCGLVSG